MRTSIREACGAVALIVTLPFPAWSQDIIGKRQFPEQLAVPEAFVESTLTTPLILHIRDNNNHQRLTLFTEELKLRLTRDLGIAVSGAVRHVEPDDRDAETGFDNLDIALTYQTFKSEAREALVSLALEWEVGGTGTRSVGAGSASVFTPTVRFAMGLGPLIEELAWLRPLAVTGALGVSIATDRPAGTTGVARWAAVVEYSVPYLEEHADKLRLPAPLNGVFPLVELDFETPVNGTGTGKTIGTVNPGFVWVGKLAQVGLEAAIPVNERTGKKVGIRALLRFSLDDIFPRLGRPLFGPP